MSGLRHFPIAVDNRVQILPASQPTAFYGRRGRVDSIHAGSGSVFVRLDGMPKALPFARSDLVRIDGR